MNKKELDAIADEIIRVLYPTYEQTSIPGMRNAIIQKKQRIRHILEEHRKSKKNTLEECENAMRRVADVFRCNDMYIQDLSIEDRTFLNDIGHIMDWLWANVITYKYADDEKKREMRQEMHTIRHEIEDRKSRAEHIGVPGLLEQEDLLEEVEKDD